MCKFKSGIVLRDEREKGGFRLLMSPWTESHSDLISIHKLNDGKLLHFARVEFYPDSMSDAHLVEKYKLHIDEERTPEWFGSETQTKVSEKMGAYIRSIIVSGDVELLIGGQFVLAPKAKVECAKSCIINAMLGSAKVGEMRDSARVGTMRDSAKVDTMWDSARVGTMRDSARVGTMRDSARVGTMRDSAKVGTVWGSANVGEMRDSARVGTMWDSARVGTMWDSARVGTMRDSANVGTVWDSAKVENDNRKKQ